MFYETQGYDITKKVLYQDNESPTKTDKNGRESCTGNSRHIKIQQFLVKDRSYK